MIIGCLSGGYMGDRIGRKTVVILSVLITFIFGISSTYSNNVTIFCILRTITTIGHGMGSAVCSAYSSEINTL